ncbi:hypothetical protein J4573_41180 [Actinomadura barringtoniae]|uniref:Uncharacterized protein n=1 Tax=Actinomadura barringtoniae TaxID=1427535 RepID=A0A939T5B9_9ACTN|nr:hypothetical protein [Actinomadura barringtoniae]MBO2453561.1 hypothetical protein [Actinomadura barringtoniae]
MDTTTTNATATTATTERVQADYRTVKHLGHWTTARTFEVRAHRGGAVLDLRSPRIPEGDIEIHLNLDHAWVKLLVNDDTEIDSWDLTFTGRGRVKDWTGENGSGRRVRLVGQLRGAEVRVHRGGVATLSAMFSREYVEELRKVHKEGGTPTIADPNYEG